MSEEIVGAYSTAIASEPRTTVEKLTNRRYEVWTNKTLVLRTVHEMQALRRASEVEGTVRVVSWTE